MPRWIFDSGSASTSNDCVWRAAGRKSVSRSRRVSTGPTFRISNAERVIRRFFCWRSLRFHSRCRLRCSLASLTDRLSGWRYNLMGPLSCHGSVLADCLRLWDTIRFLTVASLPQRVRACRPSLPTWRQRVRHALELWAGWNSQPLSGRPQRSFVANRAAMTSILPNRGTQRALCGRTRSPSAETGE